MLAMGRCGIRALEIVLFIVGSHAGRWANWYVVVVVERLNRDAGGRHGFQCSCTGGRSGGSPFERGDGRSRRDPAQVRRMGALSDSRVDDLRVWWEWDASAISLGGGGGDDDDCHSALRPGP